MKKRDKISLLIFKKADKTITEKELKKLNKYLENNQEFKEDSVLIENIFNELKNGKTSELPENFNIKLREKLVDYNLNQQKSNKHRFPVNALATALITVFLITVAANYNSIAPLLSEKNDSDNITNTATENQTETIDTIPENTRKISDESDYKYKGKETDTTSVPMVVNDVAPEIIPENAGKARIVTNTTVVDLKEHTDSGEYTVISTDCKIDVLAGVEYEKIEENVFKFSMNDYHKVTEIIKDYNTEIKYNNEDNLKKEHFLLIIN